MQLVVTQLFIGSIHVVNLKYATRVLHVVGAKIVHEKIQE